MTILKNDEKVFMDLLKKNNILSSILNSVSNKPLTISELARKLNINRSTIRYYLSILKQENKISFERRDDLAGRPTYIKINEKQLQKEMNEEKTKIDEYRKKMNDSPLNNLILSILRKNKELTFEEIITDVRKDYPNFNGVSEVLSMLNYLQIHNKLKNVWKLK